MGLSCGHDIVARPSTPTYCTEDMQLDYVEIVNGAENKNTYYRKQLLSTDDVSWGTSPLQLPINDVPSLRTVTISGSNEMRRLISDDGAGRSRVNLKKRHPAIGAMPDEAPDISAPVVDACVPRGNAPTEG